MPVFTTITLTLLLSLAYLPPMVDALSGGKNKRNIKDNWLAHDTETEKLQRLQLEPWKDQEKLERGG